MVQIIALTGALADPGEHAGAAMALGDIVDQFLDQHGLADPGAAEQPDLAALGIRREQIDHLDAGDEDRAFGRLIDEQWRFGVDRGGALVADRAALVDRLADDIHDSAERLGADRHADLRPGVAHFLAARESFGGVHRDRPDHRFAEMLGNLEDQAVAIIVGLERAEDRRKLTIERNIDDRADDLSDAPDDIAALGGGGVGLRSLASRGGGGGGHLASSSFVTPDLIRGLPSCFNPPSSKTEGGPRIKSGVTIITAPRRLK